MRYLKLLFAAVVILTTITIGTAQGPAEKPNRSEDPVLVKEETDLVAVDVTVTDLKGGYLRDLRREDFELLEDGKPRPIEFFQPSGTIEQAPLLLVVALDLSGSLSLEETVTQREAIKKFIYTLDKDSRCALIGFNNKVEVMQEFTDNRKKLSDKLDKIKSYGGSTRIYDALDRAVTLLKKGPTMRGNRRLRKVIMVVTDGFDSASVIDKKELISRAKENSVTIYSITLPSYSAGMSSSSKQKDRLPTLLDVSRITDFTGGKDFPIDNNDFTNVFNAIAEEIASGYTLAYHPPKDELTRNGHKLQVRVKRTGTVVRTNRDSF